MVSGDAIMITAKVQACVEEVDCAPIRCEDDNEPGYGKKRRRRRADDEQEGFKNGTESKVKNWEENVRLKIRLPGSTEVS